ncbi:cysteine proteinase [Westerdykella ornata]|uniref:ubiquitinyl hydrolase 1 n=1 Tax=Westerdykella ornata TaxID=318751 RepID=A0A6A6JQF2_WESOR|nr:cysteine proteinase [Westerdykella ornata]KAF2278128.1 cysteine proteinase [Westerdykella ornata]
MTSFFGRFKAGTSPANPAANAAPLKKDPNAPQPTPLERLLADAGPIRADGSDKFFGFENVIMPGCRSCLRLVYCVLTPYINSIVQSLYYSAPFREHVISYPTRSPPETLQRSVSESAVALPKINTDVPSTNAQNSALSPKGRDSLSLPNAAARRGLLSPPALPTSPGVKPEENKDSPEYKKKAALAAGPVLAMDYENSSAYGMSESLFTSLKDIFEAIIAHKSRIGVVSPNKFLEVLRRENEMFRTPVHHDAHEFLNFLLNQVVEHVEQFPKQRLREAGEGDSGALARAMEQVADATSTSVANNTKWVHDLFEGTLTSETRCLTCEKTSQRDEAFLDLSVDLEQHSSVTSCLRKFSEEEMLCERDKFHCDNCGGLQEAEKRMKVKRLPRILALHLKRFKYIGGDLQRLHKLFHRVVYPYYLRLFNTTEDAEDPDRIYELYAVVVHIGGGPYHGHYVSIIKTQDRGWLLFDDEMVEPVDKSYVRNFFGGENVLACAYVLFYQETTLEAMQKEQEAEALAAEQQASSTAEVPVPATTSEPTATLLKQDVNGTAGVPNGLAHAATPQLDLDSDASSFAVLNHAVTAPPALSTENTNIAATTNQPLDHTHTVSVPVPALSPKKSKHNLSSFHLKKDKSGKSKEEKERKAAEKAAEKERDKEAKRERKEKEREVKESIKRQEEELKMALAASKLSAKTEEESRRREAQSAEKDVSEADPGREKEKENGAGTPTVGTFSKASLGRFGRGSMSFRQKPKFWPGGKEKGGGEEGGAGEDAEHDGEEKEKEKQGKNRFSLGRKKSTFLHMGSSGS